MSHTTSTRASAAQSTISQHARAIMPRAPLLAGKLDLAPVEGPADALNVL